MNKPKKTKLSLEEIDLFRASCKDVKPLANKQTALPSPPQNKTLVKRPLRRNSPIRNEYLIENGYYESNEESCLPEDKLYFARDGLQHKVIQQLRRGQIKIEARLDLHHHTSSEALSTTAAFIENAQACGYRWVLIIHGKGYLSKETKPVIKNLINQWLRQQAKVLAFASSQPRHGGAGALYVLLKRGFHE